MTDVTRDEAVVLQGTGGVWRVRTGSGESRDVSLRGRLKKDDSGRRADGSLRRDTLRSKLSRLKLAVGDRVVIEREERGDEWAIVEILPRRSRLARRSPGGALGERVVVANLDQVVVVFAAANPEPHVGMIDRFLVIAEGNGLHARLVVNKAELVGEAEVRRRFGLYERVGYPLHVTSTKQPLGLDELRAALAGQVSALSGPSGVGKSSLVNALYPGLNLRVGGSVADRSLGLPVRFVDNWREWLTGGLEGFRNEARAYYRAWPLFGALLGFVGLWRSRGSTGRTRAVLVACAWAVAVITFALVGWIANLYVRYALFALPIVALGTGLLLGLLGRRGWWGSALMLLVVGFFVVEAVVLWQYRINYGLK